MDFEIRHSAEMEGFRKEVRTWLDENFPDEMKFPTEPDDYSEEQHRFWRLKRKELGAKGWLFPTCPKEYGGGGLTADYEAIIAQEFRNARLTRDVGDPQMMNDGVIPALLVWATEEQKQKFLVPLLKGEKVAWEKLTEPHSGADLASYESTAVRDGDEWVINGSNAFITGSGDPDYLFGPLRTDPDAPRHRNLGFFLIPYPSPGLEMRRFRLVHGSDQHFIFYDNVRLPGDHLIGGDHDGWQVTNTALEQAHGVRGQAFPADDMVENLVHYMQETQKKGERPGGDPVLQQIAVDAYMAANVSSLLNKRTYWRYQNRMETSWEGLSSSYLYKLSCITNMGRSRDVMGMHTLLGTREPRAPYGGEPEVWQRWAFVHQHGGGSFNITKVILARRIGISRTKEKAAPTPATATQYGS